MKLNSKPPKWTNKIFIVSKLTPLIINPPQNKTKTKTHTKNNNNKQQENPTRVRSNVTLNAKTQTV